MSNFQYPVDKGVPFPAYLGVTGGRPTKYPWSELQVGDSFFVPVGAVKHISALRSLCQQRQRRAKHRYIVREVEAGYRIWRVE